MKMRIRFFAFRAAPTQGLTLALAAVVLACAGAFAQTASDAAADPVVLAVQKVLPAVVNIRTEQLVSRQFADPFEDLWRQFFGQPRRPYVEGAQSLGSGVVVDEDGWLVSNWHVVRRATKIHVVMSDGTSYEAKYVSGDEANDLALLKIEPKKPLPFVDIASEREPLLGETVIAVGNPFGLEHTVTRGIISAKSRKYSAGDVTFDDILQTDAAINPGNSGGPLINTRGQLVGINMAILSQAQGIGFAIPAARVANMLSTWLSPEKRAHLWLGVRFANENGNVIIASVQARSPAAKAGLTASNVVVTVDGEKFDDVLQLQRHLLHKKAGDTVKLDAIRNGKTQTFTVKLVALPKLSAIDLMRQKFGLQVQELTPDLASAMGVPVAQGLIVADVEKGGPAASAGFKRGIVITQVGGEEIQTLDRLSEQLADIKADDSVPITALVIERRGNFTFQQTTGITLKAR
jgi:S1-C subfamily serine protease